MQRQLWITGLFWGLIFFFAGVITASKALTEPGTDLFDVLANVRIITLFGMSALMVVSGFIPPLVWAQPIIMFVLTPLPLMGSHDSFYGLGFFAVGVIVLFRLGFYDRHRVVKLISSMAYLFACEIFAVLRTGDSIYYALTPLFFMTCFLLFFVLTFQEKLSIYLREPKPLFSLKGRGLSAAECIYVKAVALGKMPKEIAFECNVSESTVRNSLSRSYRKLSIDDKSAIMTLAEKYDIVE